MGTGESVRAGAFERVYQIRAYAVVQAWIRRALVDVDLALRSRETLTEKTKNFSLDFVHNSFFFL